jgi:hypothetical protein
MTARLSARAWLARDLASLPADPDEAAGLILARLRRHDYAVVDVRTLRSAAEAADYAAEDYAYRSGFDAHHGGDEGDDFQEVADDYSALAASLRAIANSTTGEAAS